MLRPLVRTGPEYPKALRNAHTEGRVHVSFVLDTSGRIVKNSAQVTVESDRAFGQSVCQFLAKAKYAPVTMGGRTLTTRFTNVRFVFSLGRP